MSEVNWGVLAAYPNAGQGFADAFQGGMKRNALSALAMNPTDPNAQSAAAGYDPGAVMQVRQQQGAAQADHEAQVAKEVAALAKWADTPEKWQQAIDHAVEIGYTEAASLRNLPPDQIPAARAAVMAHGGLADDKPAQPNIAREVEYYRSIGRDDLAQQLLERHAEGGPIVANNGDGTFTVIPRGGASGQVAQPPSAAIERLRSNPHEAAQFDEIFGPGASSRVLGGGGQAATPSATFPGPN